MKCQEDDDFVANFEKMMSEDLQSRKVENIKVPQMDVAVPLHLKGPKAEKSKWCVSACMCVLLVGLGLECVCVYVCVCVCMHACVHMCCG